MTDYYLAAGAPTPIPYLPGNKLPIAVRLAEQVLAGRTFKAFARATPVTPGVTPGDADAEFDIDASQDGDDVVLVLNLTGTQTNALPQEVYWDLGEVIAGEPLPQIFLFGRLVRQRDRVTT